MGKRHRRIRARSATGQVAGAATEKPGLNTPIAQTGLPNMRSPTEPLSRSTEPTPDQPDQQPLRHFHAPTSDSLPAWSSEVEDECEGFVDALVFSRNGVSKDQIKL